MKITMIEGKTIPFDAGDVLKSLGMSPEHRFAGVIGDFLERTQEIAHPKGFYMECPVEKVTEHSVTLGGITFYSELLAKMLSESAVVYPYLCTCGEELAEYAGGLRDVSEQFAFDAIMDFYRKVAEMSLWDCVLEQLPEGLVPSHVYVGSLSGWHIREQKKLFDLFGENASAIGVTLNSSYMMNPLKSIAGIAFGTRETIPECAGCRRKDCSLRTEPFDEKVYLKALYRI